MVLRLYRLHIDLAREIRSIHHAPQPQYCRMSMYKGQLSTCLPTRASWTGEASSTILTLWWVNFFLQPVSSDFVRRRSLDLLFPKLAQQHLSSIFGASYLFRNLETFLLGNRNGSPSRTGMQHAFPDRRLNRASVHEDHDVRTRVVKKGIPGRS